MMKIYVGNLPWSIKDDELREMFIAYGEVASASVIMDKFSGRSKGFGREDYPTAGREGCAEFPLEEISGAH